MKKITKIDLDITFTATIEDVTVTDEVAKQLKDAFERELFLCGNSTQEFWKAINWISANATLDNCDRCDITINDLEISGE